MPTPPAGASVSAEQAETDPGFRRGDEKVDHSARRDPPPSSQKQVLPEPQKLSAVSRI